MPRYKTQAGTPVLGWELVGRWDFTAAANVAAPGADPANMTVGTLTFGTENANGGANGTVVNTNGVGIVITPAASTAVGVANTASNRSAPILTFTLAQLGLTADEGADVLIVFKHAVFDPSNNNCALQFGIEDTTNPMGTGTSGRGQAFGPGRSTSDLALHTVQGNGGSEYTVFGATTTPPCETWRTTALRWIGTIGAVGYASDDATVYDLDDPLPELALVWTTGRHRPVVTAEARVAVWLTSASVATPDTATLQGLAVYRRAAT